MDGTAIRDTAVDYLLRTIWALVVAGLALFAARAVRLATIRALARQRAHANVTVLLGNLAQLLVITLGVLVILAIYTDTAFGWILTSFSVIGLVIGLSLQDILKNFFAGIWVLVERPFRIGDTIEVSGYTGVVEEISFRTTQLRTGDGREVIIPNGSLMTEAVVNLTRYPARSAVLWVTVPSEEARAEVPEQLRSALAGEEGLAAQPLPSVQLRSVTEGKARYHVTVWGQDRESALAAALAAVRARFPQWEVQGA
jgi:small conductance mechanosensitive channel